jgi:ABC-type transport system substrate-binding protein
MHVSSAAAARWRMTAATYRPFEKARLVGVKTRRLVAPIAAVRYGGERLMTGAFRWMCTWVGLCAVAVAGAGSSAAAPSNPSSLSIYTVGDARTLDPHLANDFPSAENSFLLHLRLLAMDATGRLVPLGAKSWTVTGGGLVYVFHLDPRAKFHSGRVVTAADWKWSFDRLGQPKTGSGAAPSVIGGIAGFDAVRRGDTDSLTGVRVVDPLTLQIALSPAGRGGFLNRLTSYNAVVLDKDVVTSGGALWYEKADGGAGPFRLTRWDRNSMFTYAAYSDFVGGAPKVDRLQLLIVPSAATRLNLYDAGQLDISDVPLSDFRRISGDARYKDQLRIFPRAQVLFLGLNPVVYKAFADVRVRRAVAQSIDTQTIARTVFIDFYTAAHGIVPPQVPGVDARMKGLPYDPDAAKKALADAGMIGKLPSLGMAVNPSAPDYELAAEASAAMLKQTLGLDVRIQQQDFAGFTAALDKRDVLASFMQGWSAGFLDYSYFLDVLLDSHSGVDRTNYNNPEFDRLIDEANAQPTEAAREAVYRKAEQLAVSDATMIPIAFTRFALLVKPYVHGFTGSPLSLGWTDLGVVDVRR